MCANLKTARRLCRLWGGQPVSRPAGRPLVSFPSSSDPLFHVCVLPVLFHSVAPVYHDNSFQRSTSPMHCPDHRWPLAGAFSLLQPQARIVKRLAGPARIPCKQPPAQLVVSATSYDQGGRVGGSLWVYALGCRRGLLEEACGFM